MRIKSGDENPEAFAASRAARLGVLAYVSPLPSSSPTLRCLKATPAIASTCGRSMTLPTPTLPSPTLPSPTVPSPTLPGPNLLKCRSLRTPILLPNLTRPLLTPRPRSLRHQAAPRAVRSPGNSSSPLHQTRPHLLPISHAKRARTKTSLHPLKLSLKYFLTSTQPPPVRHE